MGMFDRFIKTEDRALENRNAPVSADDFCISWDRFIEFEAKMRKQRKREAEERQRQIAQTIGYISWGLITVTSLGGFSLLYFFTEFLRGLR